MSIRLVDARTVPGLIKMMIPRADDLIKNHAVALTRNSIYAKWIQMLNFESLQRQ